MGKIVIRGRSSVSILFQAPDTFYNVNKKSAQVFRQISKAEEFHSFSNYMTMGSQDFHKSWFSQLENFYTLETKLW